MECVKIITLHQIVGELNFICLPNDGDFMKRVECIKTLMIEQTYMAVSLWASAQLQVFFAALLVAKRHNYKSVTKTYIFIDQFNQSNL